MGGLKEGDFVERKFSGHRGGAAVSWRPIIPEHTYQEMVAGELARNFKCFLRGQPISIEGVPGDREGEELAKLIGRPTRTRDVLVVGSDMSIYFALLVAENYFAAGRRVVGMGCATLCVDQKHVVNGCLDDTFNNMLKEIHLPYFHLRACMVEVRRGLIDVRWGQG